MKGSVAVIGAGPAGLMAAEVLAEAGMQVHVYDAMPSPGRKFLLAGVGGMNITHAEPFDAFYQRYGRQQALVVPWLREFNPELLREWIHGLGVETFVGTSGRVFPREMKAAPLLRKWLQRLRSQGVKLHMRHRWKGWHEDGALLFDTGRESFEMKYDAVVLALGGASWPKLGSDGRWSVLLQQRDVKISPLRATNCGFDVSTEINPEGWSSYFAVRYAGDALKSVRAHVVQGEARIEQVGECVVTSGGLEGGVIYALSRHLRENIEQSGQAVLWFDLLPDKTESQIAAALARAHGKQSRASHWRKSLGLHGVKAGLLREVATAAQLSDPATLAALLKSLPIHIRAIRPLEEAISTAGGVSSSNLDYRLMLRDLPGVFCAGEMLDWEAPTGGYLLTACLASGRVAGNGVLEWLAESGV